MENRNHPDDKIMAEENQDFKMEKEASERQETMANEHENLEPIDSDGKSNSDGEFNSNPESDLDSDINSDIDLDAFEAFGLGGLSGKANAKAAAELQEYKDKYVRLFAEFENFRRRTAKENFELMANANHKLLGKMTEVLDNFNLAFDPKNKVANPDDFEKGIRLIFNRFKEILSDEGLSEVDPIGEEFDPNLHEALMQQPSETVDENHIIQVFQKGYKSKNKILKHAKVIVSTGKP